MADSQNCLTLIPAPDEPPTAIRHISLPSSRSNAAAVLAARAGFGRTFGGGFVRGTQKGTGGISAGPLSDLLGTLRSTVIGGVAVGWLQRRAGRKVKLEIGDVRAEASTVAEVRELIAALSTMRKNPLIVWLQSIVGTQ